MVMLLVNIEEICAPQVDDFVYVTDNTYFKKEVCCSDLLKLDIAIINAF